MIEIENFLTTQDQKIRSEFITQALTAPEKYLDRLLQPNKNCAYALSVLSRKGSVVKMLEGKIDGVLKQLFNSQDAKIRKYAYVIAGNINNGFSQRLLKESVETESTFYTLPSLMLALGSQKTEASRLMERIEKERELIAPKIYTEIVSAFQRVCPIKTFQCSEINFEKEDFLLCTQRCYEDFLCKQLAFKKIKTKRGIVCKGVDLTGFKILSARRDIYDIYLIVGEFDNINTATQATLLKLQELVKNNRLPIGYRVSCNDITKREKIISACKSHQGEACINSPSDYSVTLDFFIDKAIVACIKFEKFKPDFSYRAEFLPASINPVTANIIAQIAQLYNPNATTACDPFCGTATTLVERFFVNQSLRLYGSDISADAIKKAKTNLLNAKIKATLSVKSITDFKTNCDEIISNLPYGLRVGSHQGNREIYQALILACEKYLSIGGYGFLYTADKKLLRDLIKSSSLTLVEELNFISGGLFCSLFLIKRNK